MADLRVDHGPQPIGTQPASADQRRQGEHRDRQPSNGRRQQPGAEELAVALHGTGHGALRARFEQDSEGHPLVRIIDRDSGETVALLTPEELRDMADATGLPPGLLVQLAS
jgi:hypothetical protein